MLSLIVLLGICIIAIVVIGILFAIGATIYKLGINKRTALDEQYYTRSYDWKTSDH